MDEQSVHRPLLLSDDSSFPRKTSGVKTWAKWVLKLVMWVVFISWVALIFLYPTHFVSNLFNKWIRATEGTAFGITGSIFLVFSGPILIIALLSVVYLLISGDEEVYQKKTWKHPSFRLWTFPVLVEGPFEVVSAAEFIGIFLFVVFVLWAVYSYTVQILGRLSDDDLPFKQRGIFMLEIMGLRFGGIGLFCLAFLFLPISRGSVLLRLIDIPFEHATRYHVWLGHLTMLLFTLHGLFFVIGWAIDGRLLQELVEWKDIGVANLPGVISLLAGLLMWVTSLGPVRKKNFELFFYTHQLYIVFVVFLALHVGDFIFSFAAGPIFLFMLDRFLRFWQSRTTVDIISAKCLPCGTVELVLSKPESLRYNALSFIFLQVRELSSLQWHPFSVSSSPLDGKHHLSVLIKVLGEWTEKLRGKILDGSEQADQQNEIHSNPNSKMTVSVEGPYGHESPYYLTYENLVLVAGGIGLSPFLAILSDILHRVRDGKPCLPKNILVVWAVKRSNELPLLSAIDIESICPTLATKLNLETHIYVTRESEPSLEEGKVQRPTATSLCPLSKGSAMSVLVGTGDNILSGLYVISSTVGFVILLYLLDIYYINAFSITKWWYKGLLLIACMSASVLVFGGFVVGLWHIWGKRVSGKSKCEKHDSETVNGNHNKARDQKDSSPETPVSSTATHWGSRPDFKEIFESVSDKWGQIDVGVFVCGPPTLQSSIAKEIRSHNVRRQRHHPIFHFNSHSFDL